MKKAIGCALLAFVSASVFAQSNTERPSGLTTLYALDPLSNTLCLGDGQAGNIVQHNEIRNRCSDLDFNSYNADSFTVGIEGSRVGNIVDLGSADELAQRYGYSESKVATGQGFASLRFEQGKIVILKTRTTVQELRESGALFKPGTALAAALVKVGHIYLVCLTDSNEKSWQLMAKFIVVSYVPRESVTIRWQTIPTGTAALSQPKTTET